MRDLDKYQTDYLLLPFEHIQLQYRRKKVLEFVGALKPRSILEIGCGNDTISNYIVDYDSFYIVEPGRNFFSKAKEDIRKKNNIKIFNDYFENSIHNFLNVKFDLVIISSLLHEIEDTSFFLNKLKQVCNLSTIVHINTPNAHSFHRLLAVEMDLISDIHSKSSIQSTMQQNSIFNIDSLKDVLIENNFEVIDSGSFFIKPFTHEQMQKLYDQKIITDKILDGLFTLTDKFPQNGSEIYVNCKLYR
jgi:2-polyprenyl-3-methyl-5-hydroxy-6-metoxy-1,4-benzoquinol methylase